MKIDYFISGVWKDAKGVITHVMIHDVIENGLFRSYGTKTTVNEVIKLLKSHKTIFTMKWEYPSWRGGAKVVTQFVNGIEIIKTVPNTKENDNLDNLFPYGSILQ